VKGEGIFINERIHIAATELDWTFSRASGPGGQNVNKVASRAQLRWNVIAARGVPEDVKSRLLQQQRQRLTANGDLLIAAQEFRDQQRNRQACVDRLRGMVIRALAKPKARKKTRPSRSSKEARLEAKKRHGAIKAGRGRIQDGD
jgi:ribosome-associated protein